MLLIVGDVAGKLVPPELPMALRGCCSLASLMPMPKTPVDEDDRSVLWQDDVGLPWQAGDMDSEPVSSPMEK